MIELVRSITLIRYGKMRPGDFLSSLVLWIVIAGLFSLIRRDVLQCVLWRDGHIRQSTALTLGCSQWVVELDEL